MKIKFWITLGDNMSDIKIFKMKELGSKLEKNSSFLGRNSNYLIIMVIKFQRKDKKDKNG